MDGVNNALIVTAYCDVVTAQPVAVIVSVTVSQPEPGVFQVTVTELFVDADVIVPPEEIDQE
jgi:hypothetical protein